MMRVADEPHSDIRRRGVASLRGCRYDLYEIVERWAPDTEDASRTQNKYQESDMDHADPTRPVDVEGFRAMMREVGDEEIADTTLTVYASEAPGIMARITNAVTSGNCDEIRAGALSLKSASGTIRANHLAELLRRLEELGREGEVAAATEFFQEVSAEYHAVMAYLADQ